MTDNQLVTLAQSGHSEGVAQLYDKYYDAMYRFCYWQTNKDSELAQDITHDIFIEMARSIKGFKGVGSFKNWLYTIARRQITSWIKKKYDAQLEPLFDNIPEPDDYIDPETQKTKIKALDALLSTLKPKVQKVVCLRYLRGYSVSEAAHELGISEANVKVMTHRALKKLATLEYDPRM